MTQNLLEIKNLNVLLEEENKEIIKGLNLTIRPGEVHAIMGPNGSGKSTLSYFLSGREGYVSTTGDVLFNGENLLDLEPEERASKGLFLAFQYPVEIPGVSNMSFLKTALNAQRKMRGEKEVDAMEFLKLIRAKREFLNMSDDMLKRGVNVGFSGGEKKKNEILQLSLLESKLAILDETDSGLDIDALKIVAEGVNRLRSPDRSFLIITHYQRLLDYIEPDHVHVFSGGRIVKSDGKDLAIQLEKEGYGQFDAA